MKMFTRPESESSTAKRLGRDQLLDRLRLCSPGLAEELYKIAQNQLAGEDRRETLLTSKSVSLLSVSGVAFTLVFTFGAKLLEQPGQLAVLPLPIRYLVSVAYVVALICALMTSLRAVRSMRVTSEAKEISEASVFHEAELAAADALWADANAPATDATGVPIWRDKPEARYRRFMTAETWLVYQSQFALHERKALIIQNAQDWFRRFLVLIARMGLAIAYAAVASPAAPASAPEPRRASAPASAGAAPVLTRPVTGLNTTSPPAAKNATSGINLPLVRSPSR